MTGCLLFVVVIRMNFWPKHFVKGPLGYSIENYLGGSISRPFLALCYIYVVCTDIYLFIGHAITVVFGLFQITLQTYADLAIISVAL